MELLTWPHVTARFCSRTWTAALIAFCIALSPRVLAAAEPESVEYAVKAAYLCKFGSYVEWPSTAFASPSSPINLCVVGADPFGAALDAAARGQGIGVRAISILRFKTLTQNSGCHILYIHGSETQRPGPVIAGLRNSGVLTVTDAQGPADAGIINFVIKDNRVRFDIDEEAAAQNGLAISSRLLSLALNVKRRAPSKEGQ